MRQEMEERYGPEFATFLRIMKALRAPMAATYPEFKTRTRLWYEIVDGDVLDLLAHGRHQEALDRLASITGLRPEVELEAPEYIPAWPLKAVSRRIATEGAGIRLELTCRPDPSAALI